MTGCQEIAEGMIDAEAHFRNVVVETIGCTDEQAEAIRQLYVKSKLIKVDHIARRYNVRHGAFLDLDVLRNALSMVA
jgi:hypothetical protein